MEQLKQVNGGTDVEAIKSAIENLNKAWEPVAQKMYQAAQKEAQVTPNGAEVNTDTPGSSESDAKEGEVQDADFEVVDDEK